MDIRAIISCVEDTQSMKFKISDSPLESIIYITDDMKYCIMIFGNIKHATE